MATSSTIETIETLVRPIVEDRGYELVDLQLRTDRGRLVLRLLVDRPGGITLDECASVSREVAPHLEVADPIRGAYVLEVSSPGIRRPLKRPGDFERFQGERVRVRTRDPVDGRRTFRGICRGLDEAGRVVVEDARTGTRTSLDPDGIQEANLDPEIRF